MQEGVDKNAFILRYMLERKGKWICGEELAAILGITRVALHKRIKRLRELGVRIESVERKGYMLEEEPDLLIPEVVKAYLNGNVVGKVVYVFPIIDSTNRYAMEIAGKGESEGTVVIADQQTSGKGRMGRRWYSPGGKNLYFSVVLKPKIPPIFLYHTTMLASICVCQALKEINLDAQIKWPNDVYVSGKKICGVLTEVEVRGGAVDFVVLGVGVNVNMEVQQLPDDLKDIATSVFIEAGKRTNRVKLLGRILSLMDEWYAKLQRGDTADLFRYWREHNYTLGKRVVVDGKLYAEAVGVTPTGELILRLNDGETIGLSTGDVKVLS